jgi:hypothetical protein
MVCISQNPPTYVVNRHWKDLVKWLHEHKGAQPPLSKLVLVQKSTQLSTSEFINMLQTSNVEQVLVFMFGQKTSLDDVDLLQLMCAVCSLYSLLAFHILARQSLEPQWSLILPSQLVSLMSKEDQ